MEGQPTLLIVNDDESEQRLLAARLKREGYAVVMAGDGRQALKYLHEHDPPVLILLDLLMPVMDGFEFLVRLRESEERQSIPIVVVTAKDLTGDDRDRLNGCVEQIIQKSSHTREEFLAQLGELVAGHAGAKARGA